MAAEKTSKLSEAYPMKAGDGPNSYAKNSAYQSSKRGSGHRQSCLETKGRIDYSNSTEEVVRAYEVQYAEDMECFMHARAQEIVYGGLMVLIIPGRPNGTPHSQTSLNVVYQLLGSCLMDLARKGVVREEKVDSFNIPIITRLLENCKLL
ncbi:hypothetical protein Pyn_28926 [Prunus yedoensis var. nudiflora]|uniref:Uncharacterized protein n=1 Tax=Prunus yedoensis var. nudiflora TaxID=2094558 RepID=A0A314ZAM8_PRUYE|nr:hypothetical protein Pyn_28926 [Prunus yedoensis var. nudiflora]